MGVRGQHIVVEERLYLKADAELGVEKSDYGDETANVYRRHVRRYQSAAEAIKAHEGKILSILDIACGSGYGASFLRSKEYWGVDRCATAIKFAEKHYHKDSAFFTCRDVFEAFCELPDKSFDAIVSIETLEHLPKDLQLSFIEEARRCVGEGGIFFATCPVTRKKGEHSGNPFHLYEPRLDELLSWLSKYFAGIKVDFKPIYTTVGAVQQMGEFICFP